MATPNGRGIDRAPGDVVCELFAGPHCSRAVGGYSTDDFVHFPVDPVSTHCLVDEAQRQAQGLDGIGPDVRREPLRAGDPSRFGSRRRCDAAQPALQRRRRDPDLADPARHRQTQLRLLEHSHDRLERKSLPLHGKLLGYPAAWFAEDSPSNRSEIPRADQRRRELPLWRRERVRAPSIPMAVSPTRLAVGSGTQSVSLPS